MTLRAKEFPDRLSFDSGATFVNATVGGLNTAVAKNYDWTWSSIESEMTIFCKRKISNF